MKNHIIVVAGFLMAAGIPANAIGQVTVVNGASFNPNQPIAPGSFATLFGQGLCAQTGTGALDAAGQYPANLAGCSVMINGMAAMMSYASPGQINFVVPANMGSGMANLTVNNGSQSLTGSMMIGQAGPGLFAMNGMGMGTGAMLNGMSWQSGPFSTTTDGSTTVVAVYMTGMDLSQAPTVSVGGVPAQVMWYGNAPGYPGLQQINIQLPAGMAGGGQVPMAVTSGGVSSNVTMMSLLPTTAMMQGMPGWGSDMMVGENTARAHEISDLAFNPANNTALVTDENDDAVRVISLSSNSTTATITLPAGSQAHGIAVDGTGKLAAVPLSAKASVALIDLAENQVLAVIGTGNYPSHAAFAGTNLLVTNGASGTVSVIDTASRTITKTVTVGFGPSGIAVGNNLAVVANMQDGSASLISLADFSVSTVTLPAGSRPHDVAISAATNQAVLSTPTSNGVLLLNLSTKAVTGVDTGAWSAMGPGATVTNGNFAYVANQMSAGITVLDLTAAKVVKTFAVDPGPRALAVNPAKNQLLVMAEGTGTLDIVDLGSYAVTARINAADTERQGTWTLPLVSSVTPNAAAIGATFTLTMAGSNFQGITNLDFEFSGMQSGGMMGGGMMGGGTTGGGMGSEDTNVKVSNVSVNAAATQITATVQILSSATAGTRVIRLETNHGEVMAPMWNSVFTITK